MGFTQSKTQLNQQRFGEGHSCACWCDNSHFPQWKFGPTVGIYSQLHTKTHNHSNLLHFYVDASGGPVAASHPLTPPPQWVFQFIHWRTGLSVCFLRNFKPNWLPSQCPSQFSPRPDFTFFFFFRERRVSFSGVADGYFWRCCSYLPCMVVYLQ